MRRSLKAKLILSYLGVALATVLVVSAIIRLTSGQSLMNLVVEEQTALLKETAQTYYTDNGTLEGFFDYYIQTNRRLPNPPPQDESPGGQSRPPQERERDMRGLNGLIDTQHRALIPTFGYEIGETVPENRIKKSIPVEVDGQVIAYILPDTSFEFKLSAEEQLFLQRTNLAIGGAALAGVLIAVIMGILLANRLLNPIRRLINASKALAGGSLQQQVPVTSQDELGQLANTFNQMSADLFKADQQRRRMTADITHDLGTPLQVISGYVEMLEEGVVALSPERIEIIKTEIGHLRRLVDDLTTLAQVEAGGLDIQLAPLQPTALLERIYKAYQPIAARKGIELSLDIPQSTPAILADEGRMLQVLKNLLENAMRYTPKGGAIRLCAQAGERIQLRVADTGSGIDPEDLPYVFDRFYRADKARGGNSGKMGLGLAICKALVKAQNGSISAESGGKGQGASMIITFDPAPAQAAPPDAA
jgi:signal transduction histidine kinase